MRNDAWDSQVMDLTAPAWREHLFGRAKALQAQGYAGAVSRHPRQFSVLAPSVAEAQRRGPCQFPARTAQRQPTLKLFFNRGFEVLPELDGVAAAVAVESMHAGWDASAKRYRPVPEADRQWL